MGFFCNTSLKRLYECHALLVELMLYANRKSEMDFTVVHTHRSDKEQEKLYNQRGPNGERVTYAKAGQSKHNKIPSEAIDVAPWPIDWHDDQRFKDLAYHIKASAKYLGINILWGGDPEWKGPPGDFGHFELI